MHGRLAHGAEPTTSTASPQRRPVESAGRGQSELVGVVLLAGVVVLGVAVVVAVGGPALEESRARPALEHVENGMTSFDARSATVALGDAPVQTVDFGNPDRGAFTVANDAGWIRVVHSNYTEAAATPETLYNGTLGALVYRDGERTVAYQAGGVWRSDAAGSVVVSPPEFHYHDETLTMPVVLTGGTGDTGGSTRAVVTSDGDPTAVYPDASASYDADGRGYRNPVRNGSVAVTVHSAYYEAWASFFRSQTRGPVSVDHENMTASLELTAGGTQGAFDMPREGSSIEVRGLASDHAVQNFTITLAPDDSDAANFDNLQWAMYVDSGRYRMEYNLRKSGEVSGVPECADEEVSLTVYFSDRNGDPYQGWHTPTVARTSCTDRDGDGVADETELHVNFTAGTELTVADLASRQLTHFNPSGDTRASPYVFDEHDDAVVWEPATFSTTGDPDTTVRKVTNHYFTRLGRNFDVTVDDKTSDTVSEADSYGTLEYDAEGRVTYMHVTENRIRVRLRN